MKKSVSALWRRVEVAHATAIFMDYLAYTRRARRRAHALAVEINEAPHDIDAMVFLNCVCTMSRFHAIDATLSPQLRLLDDVPG